MASEVKNLYTQEPSKGWCDDWERIHRRSTFAKCSDIDDILSWLGTLTKQEDWK